MGAWLVFAFRKRPRKLDCRERHGQLAAYEWRIFSQNGEDGILDEIFRRIGAGKRTLVEIGVDDGRQCNTALLVKRARWSGWMIEGNPTRAAALARNYRRYRKRLRTIQRMIDADNVRALFEELGVPNELDLLSIDVDGNDYWVWRALGEYRPRVVVIEFNIAYPPPALWVMAYDPEHRFDDTSHYGASLASMCELGKQLGYALIGSDCNVVNAFFLRDDVLAKSKFERVRPEDVYHYPPTFPWHPYRPGPSIAT